MIPIVSFVGKSNVGKTTFLEKVVAELKRRGYRVATLKHDAHGFEMDQPGKDTWRMAQAGSDRVLISSPEKIALIARTDHDLTPDEVEAQLAGGVDILITEGYKRGDKPKVEVSRRERGSDLLCREDELLALATDQPYALNVPQFGLDEAGAAGVAQVLVEQIIEPARTRRVEVLVDGKPLPLKPFVAEMFLGSLEGMLGALRDTEGVKEVTIKLRF
ncbi:MAG: molybdopterin-guanine dinucleotide biosynthesis protein B [Chloroflexota bacterium]